MKTYTNELNTKTNITTYDVIALFTSIHINIIGAGPYFSWESRTESIFTVILVTSTWAYENQFFSLTYTANALVSVKFNFIHTHFVQSRFVHLHFIHTIFVQSHFVQSHFVHYPILSTPTLSIPTSFIPISSNPMEMYTYYKWISTNFWSMVFVTRQNSTQNTFGQRNDHHSHFLG